MRIHSIANSPTFGYDKKLNEEVNRKLRKAEKQKKSPEARDTAKYLREMNEYCMRMEDSLRAAEKHHDENRVDLYDDLFTIPKSIIVDKINERFPALDYRRRELEGYKKEQKERHLENDEYHWLSGVVSNISKTIEYDEAVAAAQLDINEEILKTKKEIEQELNDYKNGAADEANGISRTKTKSEKDVKNLVEKFIPNEFSPTGFESIGGMDDIKSDVYRKLVYPIKNPEQAELDRIEYGKKFPRGIMLYGPSGCGKTYFMEAIALESGIPMYKFKISKIGSSLVNGSSRQIQDAYNYVKNQAKAGGTPVFLMMDEMESMTAKRDSTGKNSEDNKLVGTLLQILDDARGDNIIVLGATNNFDLVDNAIRSRIDQKFYLGLPDDKTRESVLTLNLNSYPKGKALAANKEELAKVVNLTRGFSNRDITVLIDKASDIAISDGRRDIQADDFIMPVQKNQNMKIKEDAFRDKSSRPSIGFSINYNG